MKGDLSLKQAVEEYRDIYLAYRNFALRTREEYVNDLEDLVLFLGRIGIQKVREVDMPPWFGIWLNWIKEVMPDQPENEKLFL